MVDNEAVVGVLSRTRLVRQTIEKRYLFHDVYKIALISANQLTYKKSIEENEGKSFSSCHYRKLPLQFRMFSEGFTYWTLYRSSVKRCGTVFAASQKLSLLAFA